MASGDKSQLKVLVVEDEEHTARLMKTLIKKEFHAAVDHARDAATASGFLAAGAYDLVTLDFKLPDRDGLVLLEEIKASENPPPVIVVTGRGDERVAAVSIGLGASGYVLKDRQLLDNLLQTIRRALSGSRLKPPETAGKQDYLLNALEGVMVLDSHFRVAHANDSLGEVMGNAAADMLGRHFLDFFSDDQQGAAEAFLERRRRGIRERVELECARPAGERAWISASTNSLFSEDGAFDGAVILVTDISSRKKTEGVFLKTFSAVPQSMAIIRMSDGFVLEVNDEFLRTFGVEKDAVTGRNALDLSIWKSLSDFDAIREGIEEAGMVRGLEASMLTSGGEELWVAVHALSLEFRGEPCLLVSIENITAPRKADEAVFTAHQYQQALFNSLPDAVLVCDMDGWITDCNMAATTMTGFEKRELLTRNITDLMADPPEQRELALQVRREIMESGFSSVETLLRRQDGVAFMASSTSTLLKSIKGEKVGSVTVIKDITERRRAMDVLVRERDFSRAVLDTVESLLVVLDGEGRFVRTNRAFEKTMGMPSAVLLGRRLYDLIDPDERGDVVLRFALVPGDELLSQFPALGENTLVTDRGERRSIMWVASVIEDGKGGIEFIVLSGTDVTGRKKAEDALRRANRELNEYANVVLHDLKNPVVAVMMGLELLEESMDESLPGEGSDEILELLGTINRSTESVYSLVEELRALAESGGMGEGITEVDVADVVRDVTEEFSYLIAVKGIEVDIARDLGTLSAERAHVFRVFSNIIGNAIKHNTNPNPRIWVSRVEASEEGSKRYAVTDNGSLLTEEAVSVINDPSILPPGARLGLGLTVVSKILGIYGGEMRALNGTGPRFEVTFAQQPRDSSGV